MSEMINKFRHTECHYAVGHRTEWIDDWQCEVWSADSSIRTSLLTCAQRFPSYDDAIKNRTRQTDSVYLVEVATDTIVVITAVSAELKKEDE